MKRGRKRDDNFAQKSAVRGEGKGAFGRNWLRMTALEENYLYICR